MEKVTVFKQIPGTEVSLDRDGLYRMGDYRPGTTIYCKQGTLWVTQTGDLEDHIVRTGERFASAKPGVVVIQAISKSSVAIQRPVRLRIEDNRN